MTIGIMGALPEEINAIKKILTCTKQEIVGGVTYYIGKFKQQDVVLTNCGCGKALAAATATVLIIKYKVTEIIFTGVAGAVRPELNIGDIVIAKNTVYHDMDPRPIFPRFQVPFTDSIFFKSNPDKTAQAQEAALCFTANIHEYITADDKAHFGITTPQVVLGTIATGDKFITCAVEASVLASDIAALNEKLYCVEMEGAAVAHICQQFNVDYSIIRTISDNANHTAAIDFAKFIRSIAAGYSVGIVKELLGSYSEPRA